MLTAQQRTFFNTFGYLHVPGAMTQDLGWISEEYEKTWRDHPEIVHAPARRPRPRRTSSSATSRGSRPCSSIRW